MDPKIVDMVQYLLVADQKKLPIKRADIVRTVIPNSPREYDVVFDAAKNSLLKDWGLKVLEVPETNSYIIVTALKDKESWPDLKDQYDSANGILIPVLATIFMSGGEATEDALWRFLEKLDLTAETKVQWNHGQSSLKDLLNTIWVRQLYLKRQDIGKNDTKEFMFFWGFRAENEINKLDLLRWICRVYGDGNEPHMWKMQYERAKNHDRQLNPRTNNDEEIEESDDED